MAATADAVQTTKTEAITPLLQSLSSVLTQFRNGVTTPTVCFSDISKFGGEPLDTWKGIIEQALNVSIELRVSCELNAITLVPLQPHMSPNPATVLKPFVTPDNQVPGDEGGNNPASENTAASTSSAKKTGSKGRAKDKAPRPKNAFIIYRKEWHPKVVANFPDLHNNDISVFIGRQWKDEPKEVKDRYRSMAAEEKRQHLIDNPGYQYQPRKPSEKKKRMTKNKLAKLKAQSTDTVQDPMQEMHGLLAAAAAETQVTIDTFPDPYRQDLPTITQANGYMGFIANGEHENFLYDQLTAWNSNQPASQNCVPALGGQVYVDGQHSGDLPRYNVPLSYNIEEVYNSPSHTYSTTANVTAPIATNNAATQNTETDRHQTLSDDALISDLFDLDAFDVEFN